MTAGANCARTRPRLFLILIVISFRNTKNQKPNTRETPMSKLQSGGAALEIWPLELLWSLVFGFWCFGED